MLQSGWISLFMVIVMIASGCILHYGTMILILLVRGDADTESNLIAKPSEGLVIQCRKWNIQNWSLMGKFDKLNWYFDWALPKAPRH